MARAAATTSWRPAGVGAAIGFAKVVVDALGGTALALGTPGEEGGGGKNILHREGFFEGIDAMMLVYPGMDNIAHSRTVGANARAGRLFRQGRARRGAAGARHQRARRPAAGAERHRRAAPADSRPTCGCTAIITKGGTLPQVIPDHVTAALTVRANNAATLQKVIPRIDACLDRRAPR